MQPRLNNNDCTADVTDVISLNVPDQGDIWIGARVSVHRPDLAGVQVLAQIATGSDRGIGDIAIDDVKVGDGHACAKHRTRQT